MGKGASGVLGPALAIISFLVMLFIGFTMAELSVFSTISDDLKAGFTAAAGLTSVIVLLVAVKYLK